MYKKVLTHFSRKTPSRFESNHNVVIKDNKIQLALKTISQQELDSKWQPLQSSILLNTTVQGLDDKNIPKEIHGDVNAGYVKEENGQKSFAVWKVNAFTTRPDSVDFYELSEYVGSMLVTQGVKISIVNVDVSSQSVSILNEKDETTEMSFEQYDKEMDAKTGYLFKNAFCRHVLDYPMIYGNAPSFGHFLKNPMPAKKEIYQKYPQII